MIFWVPTLILCIVDGYMYGRVKPVQVHEHKNVELYFFTS